MPSVSVIIPTFNRADFINEAIDSVLNQTYRDFEIIIVDDGSTDRTADVIAAYDNEIIYEYQPNSGPSAARNRGIGLAKGKYLSFLDSDDLWLKHKLKIQMDLLFENPEIKICYTDEIWIRNGVRVNQKKVHEKYSGFIFQRCLPLCIISPSSIVLHKNVFSNIGTFDETLPVCEDYDLWLRISAKYPVNYIDKKLIVKRGGHADQLSKKLWGMDRFRVQSIVKVIENIKLNDDDHCAAITMLRAQCRILANGCHKRGKYKEEEYYRTLSEKYSFQTEV